ncbi:tRNA (guanosine(37)-N1)-methyltransferase TrmD [Desulfatiglans anilini]|uniref:tRNA (guanosine(37)-N1)-methyltransferase TrmD n=1 Tax=Desulfatiglans anilini TaxID=90728 RepID=UPI000419BC63|nr:tRNA (guanosine(37)-N1)-methyltransferase TrmD [Desulfatiglans anilini]
MRFDVLTLFPEMVLSAVRYGIMGRALDRGIADIRAVNIRDFARGPHRTTDDRPYGGGYGMVMKPGPIFRALESVERIGKGHPVILLSPQGEVFNQRLAWELAELDQLIFVCGRYEGVDERIRDLCIDREISIGDYVLSGGELGALVVMDAVTRLLPDALGGEGSSTEDSFAGGLLEYPHYTRPSVFQGLSVPEVLLSGNHEKIRIWRRKESIRRTRERRPDLMETAEIEPGERPSPAPAGRPRKDEESGSGPGR